MGDVAGSEARGAIGWRWVGLVFLIVVLWSLFGILTRPMGGHLAAFWPANAVLLGLFIRLPELAGPRGWSAAVLGYLAADIATGSSLDKAALLTFANLISVAACLLAFRRVPTEHVALSRPFSVPIMVGALVFGAVACGAVGTVIGNHLFGQPYIDGFVFWFVTELGNYVAILPVMLTLPMLSREPTAGLTSLRMRRVEIDPGRFAPFLAVLLSGLASVFVGGPGAIAFPVPALLWAAVTYGMFANALLALLFTAWTLIAVSRGLISIGLDLNDTHYLLSLRTGVMLIALAPLVVASVMASRNELLGRLQSLAVTDYLTGILNRTGFFQQGAGLLAGLHARQVPVAALMIDIDHFKSVNDSYGHPAGDEVLRAVARALRGHMRAGDVFGRVGGEEFCVLLGVSGQGATEMLADRLCDAVRALRLEVAGSVLSPTVSIGAAVAAQAPDDASALMAAADRALYQAKQAGRDRHVVLDLAPATGT